MGRFGCGVALYWCLFAVGCSESSKVEVSRDDSATLEQHLVTINAGQRYIDECIAAGVPVPSTVLDSSWVNHGEVVDPFIIANLTAELWSWTSANPLGQCLALPRWNSSDEAEVFGVICQGAATSKACFWDNDNATPIFEPRAAAGNVGYPLTRFLGGADLGQAVEQGTGDICTDCHIGSNAFIVHPEKEAFRRMIDRIGDDRYTASGWYDPVVPAGWYDNKRVERRLDAVSSAQKCTGCHSPQSKRGLPELSTDTSAYCGTVLDPAVTRPSETMPRNMQYVGTAAYAALRAPYNAHIDAARGYCWRAAPTTGGIAGRAKTVDDLAFLSPPVVMGPLFTCGQAVGVRGAVPNATVVLTIQNRRTNTTRRVSSTYLEGTPYLNFSLTTALDEDDAVFAIQKLGSVSSAASAVVEVDDYPGSTLPDPVFDAEKVFDCANTVSARATPGSVIVIDKNGTNGVASANGDGWLIASPGGTAPYRVGDKFSATSGMSCVSNGVARSWVSGTVFLVASAKPPVLSQPAFEPAQPYAGQRVIGTRAVTFGSFSQIRRSSSPALVLGNTAAAPDGWGANFNVVASPLGRPVVQGEVFTADPLLFCDGTHGPLNTTPPARACSDLPAAQIAAPTPGDNVVVVVESLPGARIRIRDAANVEIADGTGPVLGLRRTIVAGDVLKTSQQFGDCTGQNSFQINARPP